MNKPTSHNRAIAPPSESLAADDREASRAFAALIAMGTATEILMAFRAALVAEAALLRDSGGVVELAIAKAVDHEIAQVDRDLAARAGRQPN